MSTETLLLAAFFTVVMGLIVGAGYIFVLRPALAGDRRGPQIPQGLVLSGPSGSSLGSILAQAFRLVGEVVPASSAESTGLRKRLVAAGYRWPSAVPIFYGIKCAAALLLALLMGWGVGQIRDGFWEIVVPTVGGAAFAYTLPDRILRSLIKARARRIRLALPDALDLLVLSVEAGQSLDQALVDTSVELKRIFPDLSGELALVHLELRAGKNRADALRHLAARNGEPELRQLTNLLIQSDRFGTSMAPALRTHARYMRTRRRQQAEEAARKISVKLIFPIFFLIMPCLLLVTVGPAILQIFTQTLPLLTGGGE